MWTITTNHQENLILIKSDESLSAINLRHVLHKVHLEYDGRCSSYNRFADLSGVKNIELHIDVLAKNIQWYRTFKPVKTGVKSYERK